MAPGMEFEWLSTWIRVAEFATSPDHPYFYEVSEAVVWNIVCGDDLETAYRKAVASNRVVRFKLFVRRLFK